MSRDLIVVDTETNGLDLAKHQAVEIAWWNLTTDERGRYIPKHDVAKVLAAADVKALQVNRYVDRIADKPQPDTTNPRFELRKNLNGNTLAGSTPAFDAAMLTKHFAAHGGLPQWHHRLWDVSAYAAGVLGLEELPGLSKLCVLLDIEPGDHTAEADVTATGLCIRRLREISATHKTEENAA